MVYAVLTVTRAQSKVQKRENSMWVCIQGVYSVQTIEIGVITCKIRKYEGQKIVKKGPMTKKKVIRIFERKKCNLGKTVKKDLYDENFGLRNRKGCHMSHAHLSQAQG